MSGFDIRAFRILAVAGIALVVSGQARMQSLQQVADEAALSAVQVLGSGGTSADAAATAQQRAAIAPGVMAQVQASSDRMTATVKLSAADKKAVVAAARYVPPEQPATWAWASRQRFALKPAPVVVGSYCRDCAPNPLR